MKGVVKQGVDDTTTFIVSETIRRTITRRQTDGIMMYIRSNGKNSCSLILKGLHSITLIYITTQDKRRELNRSSKSRREFNSTSPSLLQLCPHLLGRVKAHPHSAQ